MIMSGYGFLKSCLVNVVGATNCWL